MFLIKLTEEDSDGKAVYVNPSFVVGVVEDKKGCYVCSVGGTNAHVEEDVKTVIAKLEKCGYIINS